MKVRYRELALSDLDQIFRYLDARSPNGARQVIDAVHTATRPEEYDSLETRLNGYLS